MMSVKNYMEEFVEDSVAAILKNTGTCNCEQCKCDVMAIALNHLPPKYVATHKGKVYTKLSSLQNQFGVDVLSELTRAAEFVKLHPRHDQTDN